LLTLTRKADYALLAMAELAHRGLGRASAREIAESINVPVPMLTNLLHQLLRHGLVTSTMGSKGGYMLARRPEDISVAELINAIEGPFRLTACCSDDTEDEEQNCGLALKCRIKGSVWKVHESLRLFLGRVTLAHIAFDTVPVQVALDLTADRGRDPAHTPPAPEAERVVDFTKDVRLGVVANVDCVD